MFNYVKYRWKLFSIPHILYLGLYKTKLEYAILLNHPDYLRSGIRNNLMKQRLTSSECREAGFSLIELLTVVLVIFALGGLSLFYLVGHQKAYKPDDESLLITDVLQEARQRSLTERRTMRVEINLS